MEHTATITISDRIYRFYADAARCVRNATAEDIMADALTAYAAMLSRPAKDNRHSCWENVTGKE